MMQGQHAGGLIQYAITAAIIAVVMALRWRRLRRTMPLRLERLWIIPMVYAGVCAAMFYERPPQRAAWLFCVLALAMGAALGWRRGKLMRITVDPETRALSQAGSPAALLFIIVLVVVRQGARIELSGPDNPLHLDPIAITDMLMALALGLFAATRIEMYLRGRRILDAAQRQA